MLCHAVAMEMTDLHARIAENIKVLLAITGIRSQAALARGLGWEPVKVTRLLQGKQGWTLADIVAIGEAFSLDDPFLLVRPLVEVVNATGPAATANSRITDVHTNRYHPASSGGFTRLAQVIPLRPGYQTVSDTSSIAPAAVTQMDASYGGRRADSA